MKKDNNYWLYRIYNNRFCYFLCEIDENYNINYESIYNFIFFK